jgi:hypothetical protein
MTSALAAPAALVRAAAPSPLRNLLLVCGILSTDTLHLVSGAVGSLLCLLIIGFGATAFGPRFRDYSIGTILVMLVFGVAASLDAPLVAANLPTPRVGVTERIMFSSFLLWFAVLATALLRVPHERPLAGHVGRSDSTQTESAPTAT